MCVPWDKFELPIVQFHRAATVLENRSADFDRRMSMRFSNTELHLFLARGEQAAQGNYSRDKDMILGGDIYTKDKWFNLHGMNRDDAANLFLGEACPLVSETDGTCNPNKETIDREYNSCI